MNDEMHVIEWLPAYALNILSEEETTQVAEHLAACSACRVELRAYQATADELPLALAQSSPRPVIKDRLMKEIRSRQAKTVATLQPTLWQQLVGSFRQSTPAWGMAVIVVLVLGIWLFWQRFNQASNPDTAPLHVVALANTKDSPQAIGELVISQSGEYGTLIVDNLATLDAGHQYQIWLNRDGQRTSGGVFSVNLDGYASIKIESPQPLKDYQTIGITIEPAGGSPGPTGNKVLGGDFQPKR